MNFLGATSVLEDTSLLRQKVLTLVEQYPKRAPFKEFCGDVVMDSTSPSIGIPTPFLPSYLTRLLFHPLYCPPPL